MVDRHQHGHPYGVFIKSHEDTLACQDTFAALEAGVRATTSNSFPVGYFITDRAWAFYHSNMKLCLTALGEPGPGETHDQRQISCYAHFMRSVDKADDLMEDATEFQALQQDLRDIHDMTWDSVGNVGLACIVLVPNFSGACMYGCLTFGVVSLFRSFGNCFARSGRRRVNTA